MAPKDGSFGSQINEPTSGWGWNGGSEMPLGHHLLSFLFTITRVLPFLLATKDDCTSDYVHIPNRTEKKRLAY